MDTAAFVRALTLWFVVLTFLQTGSGGPGPIVNGIGLFAVVLAFAIPMYVFIAILGELDDS